MSLIDPIRRAVRLRRAARAASERAEEAATVAGLPATIEPVRAAPAPEPAAPPAAAAFDAQLIGQAGEKRGLRAPGLVDAASQSYNRAEWSGSKDRRARKGRFAKTAI